jgi:hypothetical protein
MVSLRVVGAAEVEVMRAGGSRLFATGDKE